MEAIIPKFAISSFVPVIVLSKLIFISLLNFLLKVFLSSFLKSDLSKGSASNILPEILILFDFFTKESFLSRYDVIFINEGQFFDDLYEFVDYAVNEKKKRVYVCGLDGDSDRRPFGQMLDIIPLSDTVVKLHSFCKICNNGTPGIFSKRIDKRSKDQILVGATQEYIPVCRKHFNQD